MKQIGPLDYSAADDSRYSFLDGMQPNDAVRVLGGDNRLRSAVARFATKWGKHFVVKSDSTTLVVTRVS